MKKNIWKINLLLIILVIAIAVFPLYYAKNAEFGGADGEAMEIITEQNPEYEPWFSPLIEPASGEIESLLFALQAAIGSGIVFFILGRITARPAKKEES
jgi:cobalt/nickel transport protein